MANDNDNPPARVRRTIAATPILSETPADDHSLATLFDVDSLRDVPKVWQPGDLAEVFRHQMATGIQLDLSGTEPLAAEGRIVPITSPAVAGRLLCDTSATFGELFDQEHPSLDLLNRIKQFAKECREASDGRMPEEIAIVLYYLSILTARLRCGRRISQLDDAALAVGVRTALTRDWLDDRARRILDEGLRVIGASGSTQEADE